MKWMHKLKKKRIILIFIAVLCAIPIFFGIKKGLAELITENDVEVEENTELIYYLDVIYDGKDKDVVTSSDSAVAHVYSDYITVEDKIPYGLTFKNFVQSNNGSIGAVQRSDGTTSCSGYVVDGVDGLKYDADSRTVSFKVKDLQAGCKLTVGIVTQTPYLDDYGVTRMDFYNTGYATENYITSKSQTLHAYMQKGTPSMYTVNYTYTGEIPENAPTVPTGLSFAAGTKVGVEREPVVDGYKFTGWTTEDATVENGIFNMPDHNVTFTGSFIRVPKHSVTYQIDGEAPKNYVVPSAKEYNKGDMVKLDSTASGTEFDEYIFEGWTVQDGITVSNNEFEMPNYDVVITGKFKKKEYTVSYVFEGNNIPVNSTSILPESKKYSAGVKVRVASSPSNTRCTTTSDSTERNCTFNGWNEEDDFTMPKEDVVITGTWDTKTNKFSPNIKKEIVNEQASYKSGDVVKFKITVTNTATFTVKNIMLQEHLDGVKFTSGDGYTVKSNSFVLINSVPSNGNIVVNAEYKAGNDLYKLYKNEVEILGAEGNSESKFDTETKHKASVEFLVANIPIYYKLSIVKVDENNKEINGAEFTLYSDSDLKNKISSGLSFDKLQLNSTYYLKETKVPKGYKGTTDVFKVVVDKNGIINIPGYTVTNKNKEGTVRISNTKLTDKEPDPEPDPKPEPDPEPEEEKKEIAPDPKPEINPSTEEKKEIKKEEPKKNYIPYILGAVVPVGLFFLIIIILFRRKRTIMLYIPNIDVENDTYFIKNKLSEIDYDSIKKHKVRVIILSKNNYYQYEDDKLKKLDNSNNQTENGIFVDFINYVLKKQKAKKYDLCILDNIISTQELLNVLDNSNISGTVKLETILLRYNTNISDAEYSMFRKYTNYIGYTKEGYKEFEVNNFLYTINLINKNDDGDKIKELIVNEYNKSIGSIQEIDNSNYIVKKLD